MCGIAGILHYIPHKPEEWRIQAMAHALEHRGPDAEGFYNDDLIQLGHRRLSVIDVNHSADQPMFDFENRYVVIFNGEIFNYRELRRELTGYPFKTNSDTEVILAAYRTWGRDFVHHFKGMFAIAIWDTTTQELLLIRDRLGVRPLYLHINNNFLVFASEIRAILASGLVPHRLNQLAITDLLSFQSIGFPVSIIKRIIQLEAGSIMTIRHGEIISSRYWTLVDNEVNFDFGNRDAVEKRVRELLTKAVERRLVSDVPLGAFLSGGIDSTAIVGLMAETSTQRPQTFTVSLPGEENDESPYAQMTAKKFNTRHHTIELEPKQLLDLLPEALNHMDTPSGDGVNVYVISKAIKQSGLTVALTGAGGDELFAGYPFFKKYLQYNRLDGAIWERTAWFRKQVARLINGISVGQIERLVQLASTESATIDKFYPECRRVLTPGRLQQLTTFERSFDCYTAWQLFKYREQLAHLPLLSQVSAADLMGYTQNTLMKDNDQMSLAVALEVRQPFFDHELVEFVLAIPDHLKYPHSPKQLLVNSLGGLIPSEIVNRPKQGFVFPWGKWMRTELRSFCDQHLRRMSERNFIKGRELMEYWKRFQKGDTSIRWMEIWLFVVLEYWLEKNSVDTYVDEPMIGSLAHEYSGR
jgi:asparagine synthase (glutamine-hydrolysing)